MYVHISRGGPTRETAVAIGSVCIVRLACEAEADRNKTLGDALSCDIVRR